MSRRPLSKRIPAEAEEKSISADNDSRLWFKKVSEALFQSAVSPSTSWKRPEKSRVKQFNSVRSPAAAVSPGLQTGDPALVWRKLLKEREKNRNMRIEFIRMRAALEDSRKVVKEKCGEIEIKNKRIDRLIDEITMREARHDTLEKEIDIKDLLHCNFGVFTMKDILKMTDATFPVDLIDLDFPPLDLHPEQSQLHPSTMEEGRIISNTEAEKATKSLQQDSPGKSTKLSGQKGRGNAKKVRMCKEQEVGQLLTVKEETKLQIVENRNCQPSPAVPSSSRKISFPPSEELLSVQYISCPYCTMIFSRDRQGMLKKHILDCHNTGVTYPCQYCDKQFTCQSTLANFVKHVKDVHGAESCAAARKK